VHREKLCNSSPLGDRSDAGRFRHAHSDWEQKCYSRRGVEGRGALAATSKMEPSEAHVHFEPSLNFSIGGRSYVAFKQSCVCASSPPHRASAKTPRSVLTAILFF
jgi:hypothetical protein